nr:MAG TPA: hypothetical protein [Inoviridae sp.]
MYSLIKKVSYKNIVFMYSFVHLWIFTLTGSQ